MPSLSQQLLFTPAAPEIGGDTFSCETQLYAAGRHAIAGLDEAGRGPLAGPVVAAAVILPQDQDTSLWVDSKSLSPKKLLERRDALLESGALSAIGLCSPAEIDEINILQASLLAMKRAVEQLPTPPDYLLVDGRFPIPMETPQLPLIKGESRSASIAAASILAKTWRDRLLCELDKEYPQYNFAAHKGYPTKAHRETIRKFGPCPAHRLSYKGVKEYVTVSTTARPRR